MPDLQPKPIDYASYDPQRRPKQLASAAIVVGVLSPLIPGLGLLAALLGLLSRRSARLLGLTPLPSARNAIVLGLGSYLVHGLCLIVYLVHTVHVARLHTCASNIASISRNLSMYSSADAGRWPPSSNTPGITPKSFVCPLSHATPSGTNITNAALALREGHLDYIRVMHTSDRLNYGPLPDDVVLIERLSNHAADGTHFVFGTGIVRLVPTKDARTLVDTLHEQRRLTDEEYQFLIAP